MSEPTRALDRMAVEAYESDQRFHADDCDLAEMDGYRESAKRGVLFLNKAMLYVITHKTPLLAAWYVVYGTGLPIAEGMSMDERAEDLGLGRAAVSKGANEFRRAVGLPQTETMRESTKACSDARFRQLGMKEFLKAL